MSTSGPAAEFRRLHADGILVLANVWDAMSARLVASLGARAVATTSAGVAWSNGYPDGDRLPVPLLLGAVERMARVVSVPLTVDCEGGYAADPAAVAQTIAAVADAGAVGINLEDGFDPADVLTAKIAAIRARGTDVFVNARTDVYLKGLVEPGRRVEETLRRAAVYRAAGADGLFVPGVVDRDEIRAITSGAGLPVNVLVRAGLPGAAELSSLGVRRLSAGSDVAEAVLGRAASLVRAFLADGASEPLSDGAMPYPDVQDLMSPR
ncbi:MAG: isocitrate lyase/phosphoenolpyruvate mutase family protein [Vicinamibacteria bacterium]